MHRKLHKTLNFKLNLFCFDFRFLFLSFFLLRYGMPNENLAKYVQPVAATA